MKMIEEKMPRLVAELHVQFSSLLSPWQRLELGDGEALPVPIEQLPRLAAAHSEVRVWSRDAHGGREGAGEWKRPAASFTTHLDTLHHVDLDSDGDAVADETPPW